MESIKYVQKKNGIVFLFFFVMLLSVGTTSASISYGKNTAVDIKISTNLTNCDITISYPNTTNIVFENVMTINNGYANYTLNNTSTLGTYSYFSECGYGTFDVTYNGETLTTANSILNLGFLSLLILLFIANLIGYVSIDSENKKSEDGIIVDVNNLKYLKGILFAFGYALLIAVFFIAYNISLTYLLGTMFSSILFVLYKIFMIMAIPVVVVWFIWLFVSLFQDKETRNMIERGAQFGGGDI